MKTNRPIEIQNELEELKAELDALQLEGTPLIVELAKRLYQEVEAQGYDPGIHIALWKHEGYTLDQIQIHTNSQYINSKF